MSTKANPRGSQYSLLGTELERDLIRDAQTQLPYNTTAYTRLMKEYESYIFAICRRTLGADHDADDATQEVMLRIFRSIDGFGFQSAFKTWVFQIAKNVCYTAVSKAKKSRDLVENYGYELDPQSYSPSDAAEAADHIDIVFKKLNLDERTILSLRFMAELDLSEIAEVLELSLSATKMRLYRAMERFKELSALNA